MRIAAGAVCDDAFLGFDVAEVHHEDDDGAQHEDDHWIGSAADHGAENTIVTRMLKANRAAVPACSAQGWFFLTLRWSGVAALAAGRAGTAVVKTKMSPTT